MRSALVLAALAVALSVGGISIGAIVLHALYGAQPQVEALSCRMDCPDLGAVEVTAEKERDDWRAVALVCGAQNARLSRAWCAALGLPYPCLERQPAADLDPLWWEPGDLP